MPPISRVVAALLLVVSFHSLEAARVRAVAPPPQQAAATPPTDQFTNSAPASIRVTHVRLDLNVDFATQELAGSATLVLANPTGTTTLDLDTRDLVIERVSLPNGQTLPHSLGAGSQKGSRLSVTVPASAQSVTVAYRTRPSASALYWNSAAQSYGRQQPYLYTQSEADHARSWIPLQDTPSTRVTYDATIRVPRGMLAVMSAENPVAVNESGVYTFRMDQPVPPYLIALAVGRLEFRSLGSRVGVYAEPELIEHAVHELSYMQDMLETAEAIAGPYQWGRWDVVLMPPTYVVGGMEHPRANFINPFSVLTLDHPATPLPSSLMAHELAHAWSGNSATLATWSDVWLNEGITSYLTVRILEALSGPARAEYTLFSDRSAYESYLTVPQNVPYSRLHRIYKQGEVPDSSFGATSYIKGELFLHTMESVLGRETLDDFLRSYFDGFSFRWVDDLAFLDHLETRVFASRPDLRARLDAAAWIYAEGLPANIGAPTSSAMLEKVLAQTRAFTAGRHVTQLDMTDWTSVETSMFVSIARTSIGTRMAEVDQHFGFSSRMSPPTAWLELAIDRNYAPADAAIDRILMRGGTNGQIRTLYVALARTSAGRQRARAIFAQGRERYDASVASFVEALLSGQGAKPFGDAGIDVPVHERLADDWR